MPIEELNKQLFEQLDSLQGQVALKVKFLKTGEEIGFNSDTQLWAASVIKIPINGCNQISDIFIGLQGK